VNQIFNDPLHEQLENSYLQIISSSSKRTPAGAFEVTTSHISPTNPVHGRIHDATLTYPGRPLEN
jgi:hypothetical protein